MMRMLKPSDLNRHSCEMVAPVRTRYRRDIDGLRAIAVLAVLGYHAFPRWVPSGFVGVDIFFVISGFLISTIIMKTLEGGQFSYIEFYSRRIRRIFPALIAVLAAVLAFGWVSLFPAEFKALGKHVFGGAAFLSNFFLWNESGYFDNAAASKPLLHLWSLGIEEQFYIVWPLLLAIAWRRQWSLPIVILSIGVASFSLSLMELTTDPVGTFYSPITRIWELMVGAGIAYICIKEQEINGPRGVMIRMFISAIGAALIVIGFVVISDARSFPGWWAALPTAGSALLIAGGSTSWVNRSLLSGKWLVTIGKISYPLYLWHWPLLSFGYILYEGALPPHVKLTLLMAAFILAWTTYAVIERPFRPGGRLSSTPVLLMTIAATIATAGFIIYSKNGLIFRNVVKYNSAYLQKTVFASNAFSPCSGVVDEVIAKYRLCTIYPAALPAKTIVLWGDSSSGAWLPVFLDIAKRHSYTTISLSYPSCPPILSARKTRFDHRESKEYCADGRTQLTALKEIAEFHPDLTIVIAAWNSYSEYSNREFITDRPEETADANTTKRTLFEKLPETLERLSAISRTVVFRSWPIMPVAHNKEITRVLAIPWIKSHATNSTGPSVPLSQFVADSSEINSIFDQLQYPGLSFFDPSTRICDGRSCASHVNGINYYSDTVHISQAGALSFRQDIETLLAR